MNKQRLYASFSILGACILLFRTVSMIAGGSLVFLTLWASVLLILELLIDTGWLASSVLWWIGNDKGRASVPLRLAAAGIILHAVRVLVFVLGRAGPWVNFDVRPEYRAEHYARWSWVGVYFAAIMALMGVLGVIIVWVLRRRTASRNRPLTNKE